MRWYKPSEKMPKTRVVIVVIMRGYSAKTAYVDEKGVWHSLELARIINVERKTEVLRWTYYPHLKMYEDYF